MRWLADWWDGIELWITQLWFPFQVVLVIVVLLPLCWGAARVVDVAVDRVSGLRPKRWRRRRSGAD
jgi:hypothetical protein